VEIAGALVKLSDAVQQRKDIDTGKQILEKLAAELERRGITADEIGRLSRISMWQGLTKDENGEAQIHDLYGFRLAPSWDAGPEWPVIQQSHTYRIPASKTVAKNSSWDVTVVLPDMQIGYYRTGDGTLAPTHDEAAISIALKVIRDAKPNRIVMVGDNLDLPELGKYRLSPAFALTTQATIDRGGLMAAEVRAAAPDATEIVWLAGNHEERLPNYILDNARASFGIKQSMQPEGWPVLSVPHLCRLDEHNVTYCAGYPAADYWITPKLRVIHGDRVQSRGSTAHKYLADEKTSVIYGHIHRIERAHKTRTDHDGPREIMAASPGCLARIDGAVPSTKGGMDLDGRPIIGIHEDWQQGLAVILSDPETGNFDYEQIRIFQGEAIWRGKIYRHPTL
jgi:hypothetical protein